MKWWPTKSSVRYSGITAVSAVLYASYTAVTDASTWNVSEPPYSRPAAVAPIASTSPPYHARKPSTVV